MLDYISVKMPLKGGAYQSGVFKNCVRKIELQE